MYDLNFYTTQTLMSDPGKFIGYYQELPDTPNEILKVVQGLIIHGELNKLYETSLGKLQAQNELLRTTEEILDAIITSDPSPLSLEREPRHRFMGMCRDSALLFVSMLRYKNIPARIRAGFADYFKSDIHFEDHWLVEYYCEKEKRWIRLDTQVDDIQRKHYEISFDTKDIPVGMHFLTGSEAYLRCQNGEYRDGNFGYNSTWKGYQSIKGNLLHDLNCLLGYELLPWDLFSELISKNWSSLKQSEKQQLHTIAEYLSVANGPSESVLLTIRNSLPEEYLASIISRLKLFYPDRFQNDKGISISSLIDPDSLTTKLSLTTPISNPSLDISLTDSQNEAITSLNEILVEGARQNNLKNVTVSIPKNKLTVITGVSGSGKSSLAFDTIYAEGRRRYFSNMNSHDDNELSKPDFDQIKGLTPVIAIEQKKGSLNPRSNVGTLSGISDLLRMLYTTAGIFHCPVCGSELIKESKSKTKCPSCGMLYPKMTASYFNPNTHQGSCEKCNGMGYIYEINPNAVVVDENKSLLDGATAWWGKLRGKKMTGNWMVGEAIAVANAMNVDLNLPWKSLPYEYKQTILHGKPGSSFQYSYISSGRNTTLTKPSVGAYANINRLFREAKSEENPYIQFMKKSPCPVCYGEKLSQEARFSTLLGWRLPELMKLTLKDLLQFTNLVESYLPDTQVAMIKDTLSEIRNRIQNLLGVGLYYLTLERSAPTLSGGEIQRIRLSSQLLSDLVGLTYILDEPSIGLHPKNHHLMINTMKKLRDKGNTIIVVEHDKDTMLAADYLIDIGPGAGSLGGRAVACGSVEEMMKNPDSLTGHYLAEKPKELKNDTNTFTDFLTISGCKEHNLKNITASFPLHAVTCITGVSGSGKSSLVFDTLIPAILQHLKGEQGKKSALYDSLTGMEYIDGMICMDQSPIGKSSRSIPATYLGILDILRKLFASTQEAKELGLNDESYFSFNSDAGACKCCEGTGEMKITFQYMPDHTVVCPECQGQRYREEVLNVHYHDKNIAEILAMDISTARDFFHDVPEIRNILDVLSEVGLSYIHLNQKTSSLSGGESQRLKLAKELSGKSKKSMLYILDEPTTGLHLSDVEKLQDIFHKLSKKGHTVLIVEHNTEIIRSADWIIDMGPEGGLDGGCIVATGTPFDISQNENSVTGKYL